jgi:NAD(P)-dependent dehydrogenase (short-subunit alcohol dehydrogenase family)
MASTMTNIFGATSTTEEVLSGTDLRGKRILGLTTPFGFHSTATEVAAGVDLTGKRVIVTGGAAGIGIETVRTLALAGAEITLAVRRPDAARPVAEELRQATGNAALEVRPLDLSDLRSVQSFVDDWTGPLHILVNNAGIMAVPELEKTPQGFELQFGTNYLGHFALTLGLHRALAAANGARVVSVSSIAHLFSPVIFDDLGFDFVPYTPFGAYGQSKSAAMLLSVGITRKWAEDGILSNSLNPGAIATGLQKHTGGLKTPVERRKTPEQGAATSVLLAASPLLEGISGRYFEDCNEAELLTKRPADLTGGYAAYALDTENADRLWDVSLQLVRGIGE